MPSNGIHLENLNSNHTMVVSMQKPLQLIKGHTTKVGATPQAKCPK